MVAHSPGVSRHPLPRVWSRFRRQREIRGGEGFLLILLLPGVAVACDLCHTLPYPGLISLAHSGPNSRLLCLGSVFPAYRDLTLNEDRPPSEMEQHFGLRGELNHALVLAGFPAGSIFHDQVGHPRPLRVLA